MSGNRGYFRDKAKGIICKPMPRTWHDRHAANKIEDEETRNFYRSIVADKKPYFMRYVYPSLMKEYNTYIKKANRNAIREFQLTIEEMMAMPYEDLSERQRDFLKYYEYRIPVGTGDCIMNKICRRFEEEFDGHIRKHNSSVKFDYSIMKGNSEYSKERFQSIQKLYKEYNRQLQSYMVYADYERINKDESSAEISSINEDFVRQCSIVCPDRRVLCDIILDLCYARSTTKRFAWGMCGHEIIQNLLEKNDNYISFPKIDPEGDIEYGGNRYTLIRKQIEVIQ